MMNGRRERTNLLTVARVGTVLVDLESGVTLGAYPARTAEQRSDDEDAGVTDLPTLVVNPKAKMSRKE